MKIKLQEKHLCFVVNHLSTVVASQYFKLLHEIKTRVNAQSYQPTDEVEVDVNKEDILSIYYAIGQKPEYFVAEINREMKQLLQAQFIEKLTAYGVLLATLGVQELTPEDIAALSPSDQLVVSEASDAQYVAEQIQTRDMLAGVELELLITNGRNLIS